jgi:hypothetical protein
MVDGRWWMVDERHPGSGLIGGLGIEDGEWQIVDAGGHALSGS